MFAPPPLPRTLSASLRDLTSATAATRVSAIGDLVRHARTDDATRARAVGLLEKALADEHPGVRGAAAIALADVRAGEALPALLTAVEDVDGWVRQMAITALGEIGDVRAAGRLLRALRDERNEVRYQAVIAYARVARGDDPEEVARALVRATRDEDPAIRYIALRVAEEHADARAEQHAEATMVLRAREMLTGDGAPEVRLAAAIYLAKRGDPAGRSLIFDVVAGRAARRPDPEDEQEAVELAGALGMSEATAHLERRAWGFGRFVKRTCAWQARVALARMGHGRASAEIFNELRSGKRETRLSAVVAAGRARLVEARATLERFGPDDADVEVVRDALALLDDLAQ
jgi:HEAT repeat protein